MSGNLRLEPNKIWMPTDDLNLLNAILKFGFDNWSDISKSIGKEAKDCEERYLQRFVEEPQEDELKELVKDWGKETDGLCRSNCSISVRNQRDIFDYSKFLKAESYLQTDKRGSAKRRRFAGSYLPLPGFNPLRSEFDVEYDDAAENVLGWLHEPIEIVPAHDDVENKQLCDSLKTALAGIYNFRLAERIKRKRIVRNHGLIDRRKTFNLLQKLESAPEGRNFSALLCLQRFISGPEFDYLYERLIYQKELMLKIQAYTNYREQGIRFLGGIKTYESLLKKRLKYKAELRYNRVQLEADGVGFKPFKKSSNPLVLHNLPGYNLLDEGEKDLCSSARIIPETYYNFKQLLVAECHRSNGIRLAQARQLVKIDVNKTRKLFDHLIATKLIWLPS